MGLWPMFSIQARAGYGYRCPNKKHVVDHEHFRPNIFIDHCAKMFDDHLRLHVWTMVEMGSARPTRDGAEGDMTSDNQ
eukprot:73804-Pleurochrysis_carterae.AAC.2